jgi:hypothetical protein
MPHTPGSATYPTSTMPPDPYPKMPLSGAPTYTAEPQELPMQPTSMGPSVQLPLSAAHDPHHQHHQHQQHHAHAHQQQQTQPPIRTQFATYTSAPPHHLSLSAASAGTTSPDASSLAVPRYIGDTNPRPSKSPRHASHQSVTSSISNETASGEYRYGPPPPQQQQQQAQGGGVSSGGYPAPSETSPQSQHPSLPPLPGGQQQQQQQGGYAPQQDGSGGAAQQQQGQSAGQQASGPRDYYPAYGAGDASGPGQGVDRPYGYPASGSGHHHPGVKTEPHGQHAGAAGAGAGPQAGYGYAWNAA